MAKNKNLRDSKRRQPYNVGKGKGARRRVGKNLYFFGQQFGLEDPMP